jgi:TBC1 domain family member 8/9
MATISTQLRNFREPTKEQLTQIFFSLPTTEPSENVKVNKNGEKTPVPGEETMEISATLTMAPEAEEDSYVSVHLSETCIKL